MKDGGPAFPGVWVNDSEVNVVAPNGGVVPPYGQVKLTGMTLRDYFASAALTGLVTAHDKDVGLNRGMLLTAYAEAAYAIADAMLAAREG